MTKKINLAAILISMIILVFLLWLIYYNRGNPKVERLNVANFFYLKVATIPFLNSIFNSLSTIFIILAIFFIKKKSITFHVLSILTALFFSAIFLVFYILYHSYHGNTIYQGNYKFIYFFILITHVLASAIMLPLLLMALGNAFFKNFIFHKKVAKYAYPIWLYVSITGIVIYWFLKLEI